MNSVDVSKFVAKSQRLINDVSIERFNNALSVIDWSDVLLLTYAIVAYNGFHIKFSSLYNDCFPV